MEATPYTVPSTTTATDSTTGVRHRFTAGEVITMQRAVNHGLPGAALPAAAAPFTPAQLAYLNHPTIHNYFPDGWPVDATHIDTDNTYPDGALYTTWQSVEALSLDGDEALPLVRVLCPGDTWEEGVLVGLSTDVPANTVISVGFSLQCTTAVNVRAFLQITGGYHFRESKVTNFVATTTGGSMARHVLRCAVTAPTTVALALLILEDDNPTLVSAPEDVEVFVGAVMITDGDAWIYRDGDSDGWSWVGTAHGSVSSGPQP